ncbi:MAG: hypothetical protein GF346_08200 [Candidatus Eisenbacteria bacterium]|nr:hypothetical protein [Candidatus Latescibacterota bacterium]MBD3302414.1 hypothetical protein [Candidatus Eisenbacteria bacterium]
MTGRERFAGTLAGEVPDRVPVALGFYPVDLERIVPSSLRERLAPDVEFVRFPASKEERELEKRALPFAADTRLGNPGQVATYRRWRYHPERQQGRNPLAAATRIDELAAFPFPDLSKPYTLPHLRRQVDRIHAAGRAAGGNPPHLGGELFEAAWRLRGLEAFLIDLVRRPDWADLLLDRLAALARRNVETLARAGIDVLALDDDVGMPGGMIISPQTWRRFFKGRMEGIISAARSIAPRIRVLYHSDGAFDPIIGDLLEIGVDAINPIQPEHMDAISIRRRYGIRPVLWGTVGRQGTFSFARPAEIVAEVRSRIETLGKTGLVLCPAYDVDEPDIPAENVVAFLETGLFPD